MYYATNKAIDSRYYIQHIIIGYIVLSNVNKMKTNAALFTKILLVLTILLFICVFFDFLALHDINRDYVSNLVMTRFSPVTSNMLPNWTNTTGEWLIVQISFMIKLGVIGFTFYFLFALRRNL